MGGVGQQPCGERQADDDQQRLDQPGAVRDGQPRAGAVKNPWGDVPAAWLPYVRVSDPIGYTRRAEELGGKVLVQPSNAVRGGTAALIVDPTGAPFAMQQWPLPDSEGGS